LLVGPGDVSALASAIERLLQNADIRRHLGEQGCQLVSRRYSSQAMAERYLTAYSAALDAKKRHVKPAPSAAAPACDKSGRC
jgi:glycosyltransferase involved in cell wall biosynthesis